MSSINTPCRPKRFLFLRDDTEERHNRVLSQVSPCTTYCWSALRADSKACTCHCTQNCQGASIASVFSTFEIGSSRSDYVDMSPVILHLQYVSYTQTGHRPSHGGRVVDIQRSLCAYRHQLHGLVPCHDVICADTTSENISCVVLHSYKPDARILVSASIHNHVSRWLWSDCLIFSMQYKPDGIRGTML